MRTPGSACACASDGRTLSGIACGLAEDGALRLRNRSGIRAVRSGRVVAARAA